MFPDTVTFDDSDLCPGTVSTWPAGLQGTQGNPVVWYINQTRIHFYARYDDSLKPQIVHWAYNSDQIQLIPPPIDANFFRLSAISS